MNKNRKIIVLTGCLLGMAFAARASANVLRVSESDFNAGAGLITFSEFSLGTTNPTYNPSDYGGGADAPTVNFGGYFDGQQLSANPGADCPGAAASGCVSGSPNAPLALDSGSPDTFIANDGDNPTSPGLSGSPLFNGPVSILFSKPLVGLGLDGGFFNAVGSTQIEAFGTDGSAIGSVRNEATGFDFLGLMTADGGASIQGLQFSLVGDEPAGFDIDNLRFAQVGQITPPSGNPVPEPGSLALFGLAVLAIGFGIRRRRAGG